MSTRYDGDARVLRTTYEFPLQVPDDAVNWNEVVSSATSIDAQNLRSFGSIGAYLEYTREILPGTYTVRVFHSKASDRGIYELFLNGVSAGTSDGYAATVSQNDLIEFTALSVTDPTVTFRLQMTGKNAASTGHYGEICMFTIVRTGD